MTIINDPTDILYAIAYSIGPTVFDSSSGTKRIILLLFFLLLLVLLGGGGADLLLGLLE